MFLQMFYKFASIFVDFMAAAKVIYLALAPKSCAVYRAYEAAKKVCEKEPHEPVPLHIRNAPTSMMRSWDVKSVFLEFEHMFMNMLSMCANVDDND